MATIDVQKIENDLIEYADFEETGSVSRARLFVTAAKRWLILRPQESTGTQGASMKFAHNEIASMMQRAQQFIASNDTSAGATRVTFLGTQYDFR